MYHFIYHRTKGWLNRDLATQCLEWVKEKYQAHPFPADEIGFALSAIFIAQHFWRARRAVVATA